MCIFICKIHLSASILVRTLWHKYSSFHENKSLYTIWIIFYQFIICILRTNLRLSFMQNFVQDIFWNWEVIGVFRIFPRSFNSRQVGLFCCHIKKIQKISLQSHYKYIKNTMATEKIPLKISIGKTSVSVILLLTYVIMKIK